MNDIIDYKLIGKRIQQSRKKLKITQSQLCRELDISQYHYSKIENGHVTIRLDTLAEIATYLNVELIYLLLGINKTSKTYLEDQILEIYNKCDNNQKQTIIELAEVIQRKQIK